MSLEDAGEMTVTDEKGEKYRQKFIRNGNVCIRVAKFGDEQCVMGLVLGHSPTSVMPLEGLVEARECLEALAKAVEIAEEWI